MKLLTSFSAATMVASTMATIILPENYVSKNGGIRFEGKNNTAEQIIEDDVSIIPSGAKEVSGVSGKLAEQGLGSGKIPSLDKELQQISPTSSGDNWQEKTAEQLAKAGKDIASVESNDNILSNLGEKEREKLAASRAKLADASKKFAGVTGEEMPEDHPGIVGYTITDDKVVLAEKGKSEGEVNSDKMSDIKLKAEAKASIGFGKGNSKENRTAEVKPFNGAASSVTKSAWAVLAAAAVAVFAISA